MYSLNPDYQTAHVEDRLFSSYVNAAETLLNSSDTIESIQEGGGLLPKSTGTAPTRTGRQGETSPGAIDDRGEIIPQLCISWTGRDYSRQQTLSRD